MINYDVCLKRSYKKNCPFFKTRNQPILTNSRFLSAESTLLRLVQLAAKFLTWSCYGIKNYETDILISQTYEKGEGLERDFETNRTESGLLLLLLPPLYTVERGVGGEASHFTIHGFYRVYFLGLRR